MESKLISIVVPCHNAAESLERCVMSAVRQTYKNIEIILVDDASTDDTPHIIKRLQDKFDNIRSFHVTYRSPAKTRNFAIRQSKGDYIATLDADDLFTYNRIQRLYDYMILNEADFVFSDAYVWDGCKTVGLFSESIVSAKCSVTVENLLKYIIIIHSMFLCKKESIVEIGLYDESLLFLEDQNLFIRALNMGLKLLYLDDILYYYKIHDTSLSSSRKLYETLRWIEVYKMYVGSPNFTKEESKIAKRQVYCLWIRLVYYRYLNQIKLFNFVRRFKKMRRFLSL